jgi:hypothetical protein
VIQCIFFSYLVTLNATRVMKTKIIRTGGMGFEFKLPAIKNNLELRRDRVLEKIKKKLKAQNSLLIVGESRTYQNSKIFSPTWSF